MAAAGEAPDTRYARSGDLHIAYQIVGEGPIDLLFFSEWWFNIDVQWEDILLSRCLRRLASFSRLILFDTRGFGLSDPLPHHRMPSLEETMADVLAVVRTMVFTHLPANIFLILAGIVPIAPLAITFLLARAALSQMDVPVRPALVMRLVEPDERAAAASVTNVPRSLATAMTPALAGLMLQHSSFGWPLIVGGAMKAVYDLLLLAQPLDRGL